MHPTSAQLKQLKQAVVRTLGRPLESHADFKALYVALMERTQRRLSLSTLKRALGYLETKTSPSPYTLNTLATYAGYAHWQEFLEVAIRGSQPRRGPNEFAALAQSSLLLELDAGGRILTANQHAAKLLAPSGSKKLRGQLLAALPDLPEAVQTTAFWETLQQGKPQRLVQSEVPGGQAGDCLAFTFTPVRDWKDEIYKVLVVGLLVPEDCL